MPAVRAQVIQETHLQKEGETHPLWGEIKVRNMVSGTREPGEISPLGQRDRHPNRMYSKACQSKEVLGCGGRICESIEN